MSQPRACLVPDPSKEQHQQILSWWQQLTPLQQAELERYFDPRAEDVSFSDTPEWEPLPISSRGVCLEEDDPTDRKILSQDTFDYLDDDPRRFMHDNDYLLHPAGFWWRHLNWQLSPTY